MEAFDAVFFGRDDILLGMPTPPTTSTASASDNLRQRGEAPPELAPAEFRFAVPATEPALLSLVNRGWRPSTTGRAIPSSPSGTGPSAT